MKTPPTSLPLRTNHPRRKETFFSPPPPLPLPTFSCDVCVDISSAHEELRGGEGRGETDMKRRGKEKLRRPSQLTLCYYRAVQSNSDNFRRQKILPKKTPQNFPLYFVYLKIPCPSYSLPTITAILLCY